MRIERIPVVLDPDRTRVLFRPFAPDDDERCVKIIGRISSLSDREVSDELESILSEFKPRHLDLRGFLLNRFHDVERYLLTDSDLSEQRRLLIGAYFTQEYSLESAALFNPSMVWHPDQSGLAKGSRRFILSLRALGEGHLSCLTFRSGIVDAAGTIQVDEPVPHAVFPEIHTDPIYEKELFEKKLFELNLLQEFTRSVLGRLEGTFTLRDLEEDIHLMLRQSRTGREDYTDLANGVLALAYANYDVSFDPTVALSGRVIFPFSPTERKGIEDARFVEFHDEEGKTTYYATYTAFDGAVILLQILETKDFLHFKINTLNGPEVRNKGMALFPRKINGLYAMLSRQDNENIYLMYSDMPHFWFTKELVIRPTNPWEFVQIGNCGSPIETEAGWLVLTHGVGAMRKYTLGAVLLDLENPEKVVGRLREPLLSPDEEERNGYVPNVVYSCGGVEHAGRLIIPYAMSDYASTFATVDLNELLDTLIRQGP